MALFVASSFLHCCPWRRVIRIHAFARLRSLMNPEHIRRRDFPSRLIPIARVVSFAIGFEILDRWLLSRTYKHLTHFANCVDVGVICCLYESIIMPITKSVFSVPAAPRPVGVQILTVSIQTIYFLVTLLLRLHII